jgi:hypothetical protein
MTAKALTDMLRRVEAWPEEAREQRAEMAREIDAQFAGGVYHATAEELKALDEGARSGVAREEEVDAAFRTFHADAYRVGSVSCWEASIRPRLKSLSRCRAAMWPG